MGAPEQLEGFTTESGSAYDVDLDRRLIRRTGNAAGRPTTRKQGPDWQWKPFRNLVGVMYAGGERAILIDWDGTRDGTVTTPVVTVSAGLARLVGQPEQAGPDGG
jgi:hypothetical protein